MLTISENKPIAPLTTFRMGGIVRYYLTAETDQDIRDGVIFAREHVLPLVIIGGGSNMIFPDQGTLDVVLLSILNTTIVTHEQIDNRVQYTVASGVVWDDFVARACADGVRGIEALSAIPGTVGATPIQNVGAYGQDVSQTITEVHVYDTATDAFLVLTNSECQFGYRDSIFKHEPGRYIVLRVVFELAHTTPTMPRYPGVEAYFATQGIATPTLTDIRQAIIHIRANKLPDPKHIASVGSFFKNPFVSTSVGDTLREQYPNAVVFDVDATHVKVGAGWLIDMLGIKGQTFGNLRIYENNALVIVNNGGATHHELKSLVESIQHQVREKFGIAIEPEPVFVEGALKMI